MLVLKHYFWTESRCPFANLWPSKSYKKCEPGFDSHKIPPPFFLLWCRLDTTNGFFCACIWGRIARIYLYFGKTENLKSPHSEGLKSVKILQILRLAILGDTGICLVVSALFAAHFLKTLSFFLVSPMSAKENFVLRTAVLLDFSFTVKELQENQRFLFSPQMHTRV